MNLTDEDITLIAHDCGFMVHQSQDGTLALQPSLMAFARRVEAATKQPQPAKGMARLLADATGPEAA